MGFRVLGLGFRVPGPCTRKRRCPQVFLSLWVVVKIMVPFWVPIIKRNVLFRVPQKGTIILTTTRVKAALMLRVRGFGLLLVNASVESNEIHLAIRSRVPFRHPYDEDPTRRTVNARKGLICPRTHRKRIITPQSRYTVRAPGHHTHPTPLPTLRERLLCYA